MAAAILALPFAAIADPLLPHLDATLTLDPASGDATVSVVIDRVPGGLVRLPDGAADLRVDGVATTAQRKGVAVRPAGGGRATIAYRLHLPSLGEAQKGAGGGGGSFADPQGSLLLAPDWAPDLDAEAVTYDLRIDVPADERAVASGRLVEESVRDGRYAVRYAFDRPARDLTVAAGPFAVGDAAPRPGLRVRTLFPADLEQRLGAQYRDRVAGYIDRFATQIGPYPHDIFQVVATPAPLGLGFPTFTLINRLILPLPFVPERSLGHEVLHAWWGNGVAVDYARGNWCEALTTFMADYAFTEEGPDGASAAREMRRRWLSDFASLPPEQDRPLRAFIEKSHTASQVISYDKGAMLFLMLRDEIGEDAFRDGLRRFWRDRRFQRAAWPDLQASFAAAAPGGNDRDLGRFFAQWLDRPGAPRLALKDAQPTADGVAFTLTQGAAPAYDLVLPVEIVTDAGSTWRTERLDRGEQRYSLPSPAPVRAVRVDPDYRVFRRLALEEIAPTVRSIVVAPKPAVAAADPSLAAAARAFGEALLEDDAVMLAPAEAVAQRRPLLLVGTARSVATALRNAGLPDHPPGDLPSMASGSGGGIVWAARYGQDGAEVPLLVVAADDAAALPAMMRAVRHYGAYSWLAFDSGGRVAEKGVWPPAGNPLEARFAGR